MISPNSAIWCLSSSCLRLLPRLKVTSVLPSLFPTVTCFRAVSTQDVTNSFSLPSFCCMQYIPLLLDSKSHYLIFHTINPTDLLHLSPAAHFKTDQLFHAQFPIMVRSVDGKLERSAPLSSRRDLASDDENRKTIHTHLQHLPHYHEFKPISSFNHHTTNKCTNCMSFILNHFFKTLSLLLHVSIAYRLSLSGSIYSS